MPVRTVGQIIGNVAWKPLHRSITQIEGFSADHLALFRHAAVMEPISPESTVVTSEPPLWSTQLFA